MAVVISSGKFHVVKRVLKEAGFPPVNTLHRAKYGALELPSNVPYGTFRELAADERVKAGVPTEQQLVQLKLCHLLCRYRQDGCVDVRLEQFLKMHHTVQGDCFAAFPALKCRKKHVLA